MDRKQFLQALGVVTLQVVAPNIALAVLLTYFEANKKTYDIYRVEKS